jgi:hypothetical protein
MVSNNESSESRAQSLLRVVGEVIEVEEHEAENKLIVRVLPKDSVDESDAVREHVESTLTIQAIDGGYRVEGTIPRELPLTLRGHDGGIKPVEEVGIAAPECAVELPLDAGTSQDTSLINCINRGGPCKPGCKLKSEKVFKNVERFWCQCGD